MLSDSWGHGGDDDDDDDDHDHDDDDDDDEALRIYDTFKMNGNACNVSGMNDVVHMKCTKDVKDIS